MFYITSGEHGIIHNFISIGLHRQVSYNTVPSVQVMGGSMGGGAGVGGRGWGHGGGD